MSATITHARLGVIPKVPRQIIRQPLANLEADKAALQALVQAAVNIELFTVPLYMCTMKSITLTSRASLREAAALFLFIHPHRRR